MSDGTSESEKPRYKRIRPFGEEDDEDTAHTKGAAKAWDIVQSETFTSHAFWIGVACGIATTVAALTVIERTRGASFY